MTTDITKLPTKKLWETFRGVLARTSDSIKELAVIWVELERRGEDLTPYRNPMFSYLPAVASGKLLPEVLVRFGAYPPVLDAVARVATPYQESLMRDGKVAVMHADGTTRMARVADMRISELRQVFSGGRIQEPHEQEVVSASAYDPDKPVEVQEHVRKVPERDGRVTIQVEMDRRQWEIARGKAKRYGVSLSTFIVDKLVGSKAIPPTAESAIDKAA